MKKFLRPTRFLAALAILLAAEFIGSAFVPVCPTQTGGDTFYIANPDDCATFYECFGAVAIKQNCPDDLKYCAEKQTCSYSWDLNCTFDCTDANFPDEPPYDGSGSGGSVSGTCCVYASTGDGIESSCWVSKATAMEIYNWWNTADKAWCCDSCHGLGWVTTECGA